MGRSMRSHKGQGNWVQPFKSISLKGFFCLYPALPVTAAVGRLLWGCYRNMKTESRKRGQGFVLGLCLLLFLKGVPAFGDSDNKFHTLGTVVVTAEPDGRKVETGDVHLEETTGFVSVITRESFEGKMENLADVLQKEAAIQVRQTGGLGSFATISIRGSSSDQVLVFMDGILLNDASGGGVDLGSISLSDVEAIEVYRGVTPINFNKASVGGVINIRTLRSRDGLHARASLGYGSFRTRQASGYINQKLGKWDYLVSAEYLDSDNDFTFLNDRGTKWNPADDIWETRRNAQFSQGNLLAKVGYDFTKDLRLILMNQYFAKDQGLPSWNNHPQTRASFDTTRNITSLSFLADKLGPLGLNTRTTVDYARKEEQYDDVQGHIGLGRQKNKYLTDRYGGQFFAEWLSDWNILSFTSDFHHEKYAPKDLFTQRNLRDSTRNTLTFGLQDSLILLGDKATITPALRYTHVHDQLESGESNWGSHLEGRTRKESYWSPQIGLKYAALPWLNLKGNLARYVREPSFLELFGDRGFIIGNMDLEAEKGVNLDAGFEVNWQGPPAWISRISFGAAYFQSKVEDLITFVYNSRGTGKAQNISKARIEGLESQIAIDFLRHFRFVGNATWQDPENQSQIRAFSGKTLPGRWRRSLLGRMEGHYKGFSAHVECLRETGMYYDRANLLPAKDKTLFNAGISYLFGSLLFSLEGKNLGNEQYEDFNGYPMPRRAYYFTVGYRY